MPKVSQAHRESRRDQITDAALRCFAANGFQRTSMADIITESGLSAGAIYGHFESKQQIAHAVAKRVLLNRLDELETRTNEGPIPRPDEVIALITSGMDRDLPDPRLLLQLWAESMHDDGISVLVGGIFGNIRETLAPYLARWAEEYRHLTPQAASAWALAVLPAMIALAQGYIVQSALLPEFNRETYLAAVRGVFD